MNKEQQELSRNITREFNRIIAEHFPNMFTRQASYYYYTDGHSKNRYFYTTQKINHKGKMRYVSGVYRYLKGKKQWVPRKLAGSAKKKRAMARADKLAQKASQKRR